MTKAPDKLPQEPTASFPFSTSDLQEATQNLYGLIVPDALTTGFKTFLEILAVHQGPGIYVVLAPSGAERRGIMEEWAQAAKKRGYKVFIIPYTPTSQARDILARAQQTPGPYLFFVDMSDEFGWAAAAVASLPGWEQRARQARQSLQSLNLARERLRRLDAPLFFWMSPEVLPAFARFAADLFAVRSAVLDLLLPSSAVRAIEGLASETLLTPFREKFANLPREELEGRIRLLQHALAAEEERAEPNLHRLARYNLELAELLAGLNRPELALNHAREALTLAQAVDDEALQAESWHQIGRLSWMLGEFRGGLAAAKKATALYRRLAERYPNRYLPDMAMSLTTLANRLSEMGRREEALTAAEGEVGLYRRLAE